jgi:hypothetical protein
MDLLYLSIAAALVALTAAVATGFARLARRGARR